MNVLHFIVDQHQAACVGSEGHPQAITPNIDRLASEGVRFTNAYTQNPICTPSRVSIFSGQYCHNHGYYGLSGPRPLALPSIFSHFKSNGYITAGIGNLHTPNDPRNWLEEHLDVFDDSFETVDHKFEQTPFYDMLRNLNVMDKEDLHFILDHPEYGSEGMPSALAFELSQEGISVQNAIKFMDSCGDKPFCMQVSLQRPHTPVFPDKRFWDMYPDDLDLPPTLNQDPTGRPSHFQMMYKAFRESEWAIGPRTFEAGARRLWHGYLACITQVDYGLGLILDYLDKSELYENTIVIYHADHGGYMGTYGIQEKAPGICSNAVCRVPFIWRVPEHTNPGYICNQLTESVDIAPTITSLCGLPPMETTDGKDISNLLAGGDLAVREIAVTENPWSKAIRWKQWRFVHYQREMFDCQDVGELYDIVEDPDETTNLYCNPTYHSTVEECRRMLLEWLISTTRVATVWPAIDWQTYPYDYHTSGDQKESNDAGAQLRLKNGQLNYL